jgi:hypothetical protein
MDTPPGFTFITTGRDSDYRKVLINLDQIIAISFPSGRVHEHGGVVVGAPTSVQSYLFNSDHAAERLTNELSVWRSRPLPKTRP